MTYLMSLFSSAIFSYTVVTKVLFIQVIKAVLTLKNITFKLVLKQPFSAVIKCWLAGQIRPIEASNSACDWIQK